MKHELLKYLSGYITPERFKLIEKILYDRTRYITVALEDIYQPHNASAVMRTCDCFGIQDIHIIENRNQYTLNPDVALGSYKWINLVKYNEQTDNTLTAIQSLKQQGYRIVATTPHKNDVSPEQFNLYKGKIALFFGTELGGLTDTVLDNADEFMKIDMFGFTESFNISVSAAIILHTLTTKLRNSDIEWRLTDNEKQETGIDWIKNSLRKGDLIEQKFYKTKKQC